MKKEYVKPEMLVEQFMAEVAFLDASSDTNMGIGDGNQKPGGPAANDHRGGWGNLWD